MGGKLKFRPQNQTGWGGRGNQQVSLHLFY